MLMVIAQSNPFAALVARVLGDKLQSPVDLVLLQCFDAELWKIEVSGPCISQLADQINLAIGKAIQFNLPLLTTDFRLLTRICINGGNPLEVAGICMVFWRIDPQLYVFWVLVTGTQWLHSRVEVDGYEEYSAVEYRSPGCSEEYTVIE